jgi:hypothetical protein
MSSPTQRTLKLLRDEGYLAYVVERWCSFTHRRYDLFGIIDVLAVKGSETLAVQTTSGSAVSARVKKMEASEALPWLRDAGWTIHVHGWRKTKLKRGGKAMRWGCRTVDLTIPTTPTPPPTTHE